MKIQLTVTIPEAELMANPAYRGKDAEDIRKMYQSELLRLPPSRSAGGDLYTIHAKVIEP